MLRDHGSKPVFELRIYGDWYSAIGVEGYSDSLINQKPYDEDDAMWNEYRLRLSTAAELFKAYSAFTKARLRVELAVLIESKALGVQVYAVTADAFRSGPDTQFALVDVDETRQHAQLVGAIQEAYEALKRVY
jgi:hypothetical protein